MVGSHLAGFLLGETDWDLFGMCRWRSPLDNVSHLVDRANRGDRLKSLSIVSVPASRPFITRLGGEAFFSDAAGIAPLSR
jgi:hypothetical protein